MKIQNSEIDFNNVDCFEYIKTIPDNSVKLIVTDIPYGIDFKGITSNTSWDKIENYGEYVNKFLAEVKRILTNDGTCWLFSARTMIPVVFAEIEKVGLYNNLENWCTYIRNKGRGSTKKLKSICEEIIHITKTKNYYFNMIEYERECVTPYVVKENGIAKPRGWMLNINTGLRVRWSGLGNACFFTSPFYKSKFDPQIHSTQKPVLLNVMLIMLSSKPGDTVYDFFAGSGSSGVASVLSGRNWTGCELDKDMYEKATKWLNNINYDEAKEYINRIKYHTDEIDMSKYETDYEKIKTIENENKINSLQEYIDNEDPGEE